MERADDRILSALAALQSDGDWAVIKEWMIKSRDADTNTMLIAKDDVSLRWMQGSVQTLNEIITLSDKAMGVLHNKRTQK